MSKIDEFVFKEKQNEKRFCSKFWPGWLFEEPQNLQHMLIKELMEERMPFGIDDVAGFEYLPKISKPSTEMGWHVDEDVFLYENTKMFNGADYGCVYYGPMETACDAELVISDSKIENNTEEALEQKEIKIAISKINNVTNIKYQKNRAIYFDSGHYLHKTTKLNTGTKYSFVIAVWLKGNEPYGVVKNLFNDW